MHERDGIVEERSYSIIQIFKEISLMSLHMIECHEDRYLV